MVSPYCCQKSRHIKDSGTIRDQLLAVFRRTLEANDEGDKAPETFNRFGPSAEDDEEAVAQRKKHLMQIVLRIQMQVTVRYKTQ